MSAEPLTANMAGGPLTSPRGAAAPNVGGQVQVAARLRVRKAAAYRRLIRGLLLLLLNVAAFGATVVVGVLGATVVVESATVVVES